MTLSPYHLLYSWTVLLDFYDEIYPPSLISKVEKHCNSNMALFFQIPLYAEFDRPKLLTFLRNSNYYPLQKVNYTRFWRVIMYDISEGLMSRVPGEWERVTLDCVVTMFTMTCLIVLKCSSQCQKVWILTPCLSVRLWTSVNKGVWFQRWCFCSVSII